MRVNKYDGENTEVDEKSRGTQVVLMSETSATCIRLIVLSNNAGTLNLGEIKWEKGRKGRGSVFGRSVPSPLPLPLLPNGESSFIYCVQSVESKIKSLAGFEREAGDG